MADLHPKERPPTTGAVQIHLDRMSAGAVISCMTPIGSTGDRREVELTGGFPWRVFGRDFVRIEMSPRPSGDSHLD